MAYREALLRGTLVNALGLLAKLLYPLLIFVLTRLFGPELMGHYFVGLAATTVRVSPHAEVAGDDTEASATMNATLGRTLMYSLGTALVFALLVQGLASWAIHNYFTKHLELLPGIYFLGWAMIPTAFANIIGAAGVGCGPRRRATPVAVAGERPGVFPRGRSHRSSRQLLLLDAGVGVPFLDSARSLFRLAGGSAQSPTRLG
jgi:hypothetical protein